MPIYLIIQSYNLYVLDDNSILLYNAAQFVLELTTGNFLSTPVFHSHSHGVFQEPFLFLEYSRLILHISSVPRRASHFFKEPWLFYWTMVLNTKILAVLLANGMLWLPGSSPCLYAHVDTCPCQPRCIVIGL